MLAARAFAAIADHHEPRVNPAGLQHTRENLDAIERALDGAKIRDVREQFFAARREHAFQLGHGMASVIVRADEIRDDSYVCNAERR